MEKESILKSQIFEKANNSYYKDILLNTNFLTLSEQDYFYKALKEEGISLLSEKIFNTPYLLYGGYEEADRKVIFFLPSYISKNELISNINEGSYIKCLYIYPKNIKFSDTFTHRDILGSLMNLGYEKDEFGDILTDGKNSYVFIMDHLINKIKDELIKIKHTDVLSKIITPKECPLRPKFEIVNINISSNRLDVIVAEAFNISRSKAQELIINECVFINGEIKTSNSFSLINNSRVSVKGKGKFIFLEEIKETRKGRLVANIKKYI